MIRPSLQDLVLRKTFPHPKQTDPTSFFSHVQRNLVPEVRLEVQTFYGSLDCTEAQYPGLDYTYGPHRRRLSRYPWHRRLFRAFDELSLTDHEILLLCQWEGTRSAQERYETETGKRISDTTADCIAAAPIGTGPKARTHFRMKVADNSSATKMFTAVDTVPQASEMEPSDDDEISTSVGVQLNRQLQAAVEARSRGEQVVIDAQWDQWMKEALERNDFDQNTLIQALFDGQPFHSADNQSHGEGEAAATEVMTPASDDTSASVHLLQPQNAQRYGELPDMLRDLQTANNQLSAENAALAMFLNRSQTETAR